jgi:hypothetical protein
MVGASLLGLSVAAVADDVMKMDTNADGKISKEEFMTYHEKMWAGMKKDANGMVDAKSMMMHHDGMMKDKAMSGDKMSSDKMNH